ncbi:MAG TPA: two-component regulator propeller domain-containing protein, partial [Bryobacteraceae bacterium]|nr:two-component regulator propeller domain-containing protein [Bryobacteraceae bacterium]
MSISGVAFGRLLAAGGALLLFQPGAISAGPSDVHDLQSEYIVDSWQTEQGLPDNYVNAITQTAEGYLWVATFNGLARFNGVEFVVFDSANTPELPSSRITSFTRDRRGRLWILSEYGDLTLWSVGRFHLFPEKPIRSVREDYRGTVWATEWPSKTNYYYFTNGFLQPITTDDTFYHRLGNAADYAGHGWGIRSNRLFCVNPTAPVETPIPNFDSAFGWRLAPSADGGMWVISERVQKFRQGCWDDYGSLPVITQHLGQRNIEDHAGNLWIGTGKHELWRLGSNRVFRRLKLQDSTVAELGKVIFQDAEANLWIATSGGGLLRLKARALNTYTARDGLKSDLVRSVTQDTRGNIWLATVNSVDWFPAHNPDRAEPRGLTVSLPWKVHAGRDGSVWIGTFSKGVLRFHKNDQRWFVGPGPGETPPINAIFENRHGEIHFGTPKGLYTPDSDSLVNFESPQDFPSLDIRGMAEDSRGRLYLACNGQGLVRKTDPAWERFTSSDGLPGNHLWGLHVDVEDTVWLGLHGHALSRFKDGRFFNFSTAEIGLPRIITCIIEDDIGHLWFLSNQGLFRALRSQLNALADGHADSVDITHYTRADGMGSSQCTGNAWKDRDGKLWFTTMGGVTVVDPRSLPINPRPPTVVIEEVLIDDKPAPQTANLKVPPKARRLQFHYAGLSLTVPERVRFQYRLEGFDKDWVKANHDRTAYYTKVPPGSYRFQVIACNNDNVWSTSPATLMLTVTPWFWQTKWFLVLAVMSSAGVLFGTYKLRILQLKRERLRQENFSRRLIQSQENERKRIAAELHDSLGQNLLVMKNYAALGLKNNATPDNMREQLQEISESAMASIEEVRSIARALRPYQLDRFGLTQTLEDAADLVAKTGSL